MALRTNGASSNGCFHIKRRFATRLMSKCASLCLLACLGSSSQSFAATASISSDVDISPLVENVCRPIFQMDGHSSASGTGFILQASPFAAGEVLVTAHHLFGLATAHSDGMAWMDVSRRVRSATCQSFDKAREWRTGAAVPIIGVHAFRAMPQVHDIAILPVTGGPPTRLTMSPTPPAVGDVVYLLAQMQDPFRSGELVHRAHVLAAADALVFVYDDATIRTANISGAPIVSQEGKVVGVNVGVGKLPNGALIGVADDLETLRNALLAAAGP